MPRSTFPDGIPPWVSYIPPRPAVTEWAEDENLNELLSDFAPWDPEVDTSGTIQDYEELSEIEQEEQYA